MCKQFKVIWILLLFSLLPTLGMAEKKIQDPTTSSVAFGDYIVHFSVFNSTFLSPKVAKVEQLVRDSKIGILNIALEYKGKTIPANVNATVTNLLQQSQILKLKHIQEGEAAYYIAPFSFDNEETLTFKVNVEYKNQQMPFRFTKKLYED